MTDQEQIDALRDEFERFRDQHEVDMSTMEAALARLSRPNNSLKGYRTKIAGWVATMPTIMIAGGFQVDPQLTAEILKSEGWLAAAIQIGLGYAVHHFRNKAGEPVKP